MFRKLRNKMLLFNMISVSIVIVTAFSVIYFATYSNTERENRRQLRTMAAMPFAASRPAREGRNEPVPLPGWLFGADYRVSFVLFTKDGHLESINSHLDFADSFYAEALEKISDKPAGKITHGGRKWAYMTSEAPFNDVNHFRQIVFLDITNSVKTLRELLITLSCTGIAVLLVLFWSGYRFAVRAVRPIEESYNKQKQFVADASHEFRTPLSIISANIDAIEASANESVESQKEWFGYIRAELKRTTKLVDNLLYLAGAENVDYNVNTPFNLSRACETACTSMEAMLYDNGISLDTKIAENITVLADGEKITQVLYVLMDNAGKYTPHNGRIIFTLNLEQEWAVIRVSNTGQGIDPKDITKIFDRFYRPDTSRSQETGGFGLGLSIAKTIVERSGGKISAESSGGMTTFTVWLKHI